MLRLIIIFWLILSTKVQGEAFGNTAVLVPKAGIVFFDKALFSSQKPWGLSHQWTAGTSYQSAIDYRWWWTADTTIGFGQTSKEQTIASIAASAGLRFNIFEEDFRPHFTFGIQYLHFLGRGTTNLGLGAGWPIFVGLRPGFGLEWLFYPEMALILYSGYNIYFNINEPVRQAVDLNMSFAFYF